MIDLKQLQKDIWANKVAKGFNTTNVEREFNYTYGELAEAYEAYRKKKDDLGEELADVMIYLFSLAEMLGIELEDELTRKIDKNARRRYEQVNGLNVRLKEDDQLN